MHDRTRIPRPSSVAASTAGDGVKFETNRGSGTEKVEFKRPQSLRVGQGSGVRVPGSDGFCTFKSPSSTLIVPGRTRKHRCAAPVPIVGVWGGVRNKDAMAHLAIAMQARNARLASDGNLVRDQQSQFLVTDEELSFGLRLIAREVRMQLARCAPGQHVWFCTHGHDGTQHHPHILMGGFPTSRTATRRHPLTHELQPDGTQCTHHIDHERRHDGTCEAGIGSSRVTTNGSTTRGRACSAPGCLRTEPD